jgi:GAF domain-containing protein
VFALATSTGIIASPFGNSGLLRMIVETASHFLAAQAASLFLVDEERRDLVVATALGPRSAQVEQIRVPLGHGIAGLVAASGQPLAIANAATDPRHAANISQLLGHVPQSILCVPLFYNEQVIGVLELFDKEDATAFSATDIEALSQFADLAAVAIEQSGRLQHLASVIAEVLGLLGQTTARADLAASSREFARRIEEHPTFGRALDLARIVQEIGRYGDQELDTCRTLVGGFAEYLRSRPRSLGEAQ